MLARMRHTGQIHKREGRHPDRTAIRGLRVSAAALDDLRNTNLTSTTGRQKRMDGFRLRLAASTAAVPNQLWSTELRLVDVCNLVQAEKR